MAPPAEMNKNLPETLPADFGDWDGEESEATGTVESPKVESGDQGPGVPSSKAAVARQFGQSEPALKPAPSRDSAAREIAPRNIDTEKTAPIPRSPLGPPPSNPRAYSTPPSKGPRPVQSGSAPFTEDEVFFRRIRSLNTVVDTLPAIPQAPPREEKTSAAVVTLPAPVVEEVPVIQPKVEAPPISFRTDLSEPESEEERRAKRKWMAIIGVGVGVVSLVLFQLFHSGTMSQMRHMVVAPSTTSISSDVPPETASPDETSASRPTAAKPSPSSLNSRAEETSEAAPDAPSGPAPEQSKMMHDQLLAPTRIPQGVRSGASNDAPPPAEGFSASSMAGLGGNSANTGLFNGSAQSKAPAVTLKSVTVSAGVATGMLIHRTQPIYPSIAKAARVTGTVVIQATISKTGAVVNPRVLSGPQMLRQAALDAVKTWRYKPYKLNNEPTDVDTTVDVIFALGN